ncbi:hypothetical protein D3C81_1712610 [compost metagenome]
MHELIVSHSRTGRVKQVFGNACSGDKGAYVPLAADVQRALQQSLDEGHGQGVIHGRVHRRNSSSDDWSGAICKLIGGSGYFKGTSTVAKLGQ